jgi:hypothetical protein
MPAMSEFSLPLVWPSNCGCGSLTLTTAPGPRAHRRRRVFLQILEQAQRLADGVDGAGKRGAEAGEMRAAVDGVDVVGEAEDRVGVAVVVLESDVDLDAVALASMVMGFSCSSCLPLFRCLMNSAMPPA